MARSYDELHAWQLANGLKLGVYRLTQTGSVTRDFKFSEQLRDGVDRTHLTNSDIIPLLRLAARAKGAAIGLKRYLKNATPPER